MSVNDVINHYYGHHAQVIYKTEKIIELKDNPSYATYEVKFKVLLDNLSTSYKSFASIKAEKGIPMFDFSSFDGDGFNIIDYKLFGDIDKAKNFALQLIDKHKKDVFENQQTCHDYELGLCIMHLTTQLPNGTTSITYDNSGFTDERFDQKLKETALASYKEEKPQKTKDSKVVDMFSMFAL